MKHIHAKSYSEPVNQCSLNYDNLAFETNKLFIGKLFSEVFALCCFHMEEVKAPRNQEAQNNVSQGFGRSLHLNRANRFVSEISSANLSIFQVTV